MQWDSDFDLTVFPNEGKMYKYLWHWSDAASKPMCVAKIYWFDLPPMHELKGVAWAGKEVTVITGDLRFLSFVKQDYEGRAADEKLHKLTVDEKGEITSVMGIAEDEGTVDGGIQVDV